MNAATKSTTTATHFITWGPVRGYGPLRRSLTAAQADQAHDRKGAARQGGYSDRAVYTATRSGERVSMVSGETE